MDGGGPCQITLRDGRIKGGEGDIRLHEKEQGGGGKRRKDLIQ